MIAPFLQRLRAAAPDAEIVVVDGGSVDETIAQCLDRADRVVRSAPGRGLQMNAGAAEASGDAFWFIHADSYVSPACLPQMHDFLDNRRNVGGAFTLRIDSERAVYRLRDVIGNLCVDLFGIALGDRALFCRRDVFEKLGGYRDLPLLEDGDFYRRMRAAGRVRRLPAIVRTSSRRYEALGRERTILVYTVITLLFWAHAPLRTLERILAWHQRRAP